MKIHLLFPFLFIFMSTFGQAIFVDIDENSQQNVQTDVIDYNIDDYHIDFSTASFITNTFQIPAYGLYDNSWDTIHIRPVVLTIPFYDDAIKIPLIQEKNNPFAFPCSGVPVLGYGGMNRGKFHTGIDFKVNKNDPVVACFDGVVRIAHFYGDYGNVVVIRHYNGLETVYAHLDKFAVKTGQIVSAGDLIGSAGETGNCQTPLLHFKVRFLNEYFNPEKLLDNQTRRLKENFLILKPQDFTSTFYHTVQKGETLNKIARQYDVSVQELIKLNGLKSDGSNIYEGQKSRIK